MLALLLASTIAFPHADLSAELRAADKACSNADAKAKLAFARGDLADAKQFFLDAVPEAQRTAAYCYLVGNRWFALDPEFSMAMHARAVELAPDAREFRRELALELHRKGRWAEAEAAYAKSAGDDVDEAGASASLRAECLLRLDRAADACAAWADARTKMELPEHRAELFAWVHGPLALDVPRAKWIAEIHARDTSHAEELVLADVFDERDDDEYVVRFEYYERDLDLALKQFAKDDARALDLAALVRAAFTDWEQCFPEGADSPARRVVLAQAATRTWTGAGARLPQHPRAAEEVVRLLLRHGFDAAQLLVWHRAELERRSTSIPPDDRATETLALLARAAHDAKLAEYEQRLPLDARSVARADLAAARAAKADLVKLLTRAIYAELAAPKLDLDAADTAFGELAKLVASPR